MLADRSLRVKVGEEWHICDNAGQNIQSGGVRITCPDPRRICPTFFCPYDCLGTDGECDYISGNCLCEYENATHPGEMVLDVCGMVEEIKEYHENSTSTATTLRPILQRKGTIDAMMPPSDTKFSDYYVSDVLHLDEELHVIDAWGILILSITGLVLVSFFVALFTFRKPLKDASAITCNYLAFWRRRSELADEDNDYDGIGRGGSGHGHGSTRDKHKMVASVLVDMRIRGSGNNNWRRREQSDGRSDLNESLAETDGRMTDSEIASSASPAMSDSLSDISSRQIGSETMSDMEDLDSNTSRGVINEVDLLPPEEEELPQQQTIVRRRRFVPNMFA